LMMAMATFAVAPAIAQEAERPRAPEAERPQPADAEEKEKEKEGIDRLKPYRKQGNTWTERSTSKMGESEVVVYTRFEILEVTDTEATVRRTVLDKDREEVSSSEFKQSLNLPRNGNYPPVPEGATKSEETIRVPAGSFNCVKIEQSMNGGTEIRWFNKADGLLVKSHYKSETMESTVELTEHKVS
jgi:hypothetical protein